MIYLFNKDKDLLNIIGEDEVQSALYDREINNVYQLDVDLPLFFWDKDVKVSLREIFNDVEFIGHYDLNEKFQLHKIAQFDILDDVIAVKGVHFFFDEAKAKHIIRDRRFTNATAQAGAQAIAEKLGWRLVYQATDTITSNYNFYNISALEALNIIIDRFNIEIDFSFDFDGIRILNKELIVKSKLGEVLDTTYYYSKEFHAGYNALSVKYEQDYSEIYTAVIPRGKGEEVGDGYGRRLEIDEVEWSKPNDPLDKPLGEVMLVDPEATQKFGYAEEGVIKPRVKVLNFNETEDKDILIQQGYEWLSENSRPKIVLSTTVDDSEEVNFGDTIWVIYEDIDLKEQFRVARVIDNLITGGRQIEIGDLDYFRSSLSERSTNNRIDNLESQTEQFPDVIKYVVSANGYNRSFWGSIEPQNVIEGDTWFKPDETSDGDTIMLVWDGERWVETARTKDDGRIKDLLDKYEDLADEIGKDIELNVDQIIDVLDGANQVELTHIFARLIGDDRFSTLFYQEAENVGFVYREGDEVKSIIAIQQGVPFIRGEHIVLDGNTIVDGDFTVTEQMLADSAVFDKLKANGIDASEINVINLDFDSMAGGDIELSRGIRLTNNGAVVMEVTSDGKFRFDATAAGVATKDELEDIALTPGPEGPEGPPGYTPIKGVDYFDGVDGQDGQDGEDGDSSYLWVMYSQNSNGSGMVDNPTNAVYIGVATTTTPSKPTTPSAYKWSLIKGDDGVEGEKGDDGRTSYLHIKYSNDGGQSFTANNGEAVGDWIGTYVDFTEADSNKVSDYTWNKVKGEKGDKGEEGDQGPQGPIGTSVSSVTEYYLASSASSGVTTGTSGWSTSMQPISASLKYLWNYEKINFSDGTSQNTIPVIIGVYGDKGDTGATGRSITGITEYYLASSSKTGVTRSTSGWSTSMQTTTSSKPYLWNYERITWSSGTSPTYVDPIIIGVHGAKGDKGDKGDQGIEGPPGPDGQSQYVHIRYSANSSGSGHVPNPTTSTKYIGIAVTNTNTTPTSASAYTWSKYTGEDGAPGQPGLPGEPGKDGQTTYTWVKYADSPTHGMDDYPDGKSYIGLAFNKTSPTESESYDDYAWSLMPQQAYDRNNLIPNTNFADMSNNTIPRDWRIWQGAPYEVSGVRAEGEMLLIRTPNPNTLTRSLAVRTPQLVEDVVEGERYTFSIWANTYVPGGGELTLDYCFLEDMSGGPNMRTGAPAIIETKVLEGSGLEFKRHQRTFTANFSGPARMIIGYTLDEARYRYLYMHEPILQKGSEYKGYSISIPEDLKTYTEHSVGGAIQGLVTTHINDIRVDIADYQSVLESKQDASEYITKINEIDDALEKEQVAMTAARTDINTLLGRSSSFEQTLGEHTITKQFIDTFMTEGEEGLFIHNKTGTQGIRISRDRIDFVSESDEEIFYISGQNFYIKSGIITNSFRVGAHEEVRLNNNSTVTRWVGG